MPECVVLCFFSEVIDALLARDDTVANGGPARAGRCSTFVTEHATIAAWPSADLVLHD